MNISAQIEALLFATTRPTAPQDFAKIMGVPLDDVDAALRELEKNYDDEKRGVRIMRHAGKISLVSAPEVSDVVKKFLKADVAGELTRPALETLTVIAYRGPVTKPEIEQIRGVNCSLILRNLLVRGLTEETQNEAREPVYQATHALLEFLGVTKVDQLPDFETLHHHPDLEKALAELGQKSITTPL